MCVDLAQTEVQDFPRIEKKSAARGIEPWSPRWESGILSSRPQGLLYGKGWEYKYI